MSKLDEISLSILNRTIEQREARLRSAELGNNLQLATKLRSEIRGLRAGRRKLERGVGVGGPLWVRARREPRAARGHARSPVRASVRRPPLKDDGTVVDPHGARWGALTAYIRKLNQSFPREDLTSLAGFFSTEREFARHIRSIEARLPGRTRGTRQGTRQPRSKPAVRKSSARKATRRNAARGSRRTVSRSSRHRSKG